MAREGERQIERERGRERDRTVMGEGIDKELQLEREAIEGVIEINRDVEL